MKLTLELDVEVITHLKYFRQLKAFGISYIEAVNVPQTQLITCTYS